jgi:flagellar basal-body rod modification protein FlgD
MSTIGLNAVSARDSQLISSTVNSAMGKDDFLKLLVAQLQAQDPLNPMDGTQFTAQLAQFSSLEQLQNVNANLANIDTSQAIQTNSSAVSFIGKTVTALGDQVYVQDGQSGDINFDLANNASSLYIRLYDQNGNFIQSLEYGRMEAGQQSLGWNGYDYLGGIVPDGSYQYEITAIGDDGREIDVTPFTTGMVTGVNYKNGQTYLLTDYQQIPMGDVVKVIATENP